MKKVKKKGILERGVDFKYSEKGVAISTTDAKKKKDYFNVVVFYDYDDEIFKTKEIGGTKNE